MSFLFHKAAQGTGLIYCALFLIALYRENRLAVQAPSLPPLPGTRRYLVRAAVGNARAAVADHLAQPKMPPRHRTHIQSHKGARRV